MDVLFSADFCIFAAKISAEKCVGMADLTAKTCISYSYFVAENFVRANSMTNFLKANPDIHAVRYSMLPYKEQEQLTNIPLYDVCVFN